MAHVSLLSVYTRVRRSFGSPSKKKKEHEGLSKPLFLLNDLHEMVRSFSDRAEKNYKITALEGRNQEKEKKPPPTHRHHQHTNLGEG